MKMPGKSRILFHDRGASMLLAPGTHGTAGRCFGTAGRGRCGAGRETSRPMTSGRKELK